MKNVSLKALAAVLCISMFALYSCEKKSIELKDNSVIDFIELYGKTVDQIQKKLVSYTCEFANDTTSVNIYDAEEGATTVRINNVDFNVSMMIENDSVKHLEMYTDSVDVTSTILKTIEKKYNKKMLAGKYFYLKDGSVLLYETGEEIGTRIARDAKLFN